MAQSAGFMFQDNRTDMGVPVFWTTAHSDPPWNFKIWFNQFLIAVAVKENLNPEILLEYPKAVLEEPVQRPETIRTNEDTQAVTDKESREKLARDRVLLEYEEKKERGLIVGHNFYYNEVQKRHASTLILALGREKKNRIGQKNPHMELSKLEF